MFIFINLIRVCVCVCVRACVRACVHACVRAYILVFAVEFRTKVSFRPTTVKQGDSARCAAVSPAFFSPSYSV